MTDVNPRRIASLDGARALSIGLVLLGHLRSTGVAGQWTDSWLATILGNQNLGVSAFFVISGLLITRILTGAGGQRPTLREFYFRRAFRIWPAFYFYLAVVAALAATHTLTVPLRDLIASALYLWNYVPGTSSWWVGHTWSLAVEEQFYLLWPLALIACARNARRERQIALAIILASPFLRLATYYFIPEARGRISILLHTRADSLMAGCLWALYEGTPTFTKLRETADRYRLALGSALFVFVISPLLARASGGGYLITVGYTLEALAIVILLDWAVRNSESSIGRLLNSRPLVHLGVISYGLYLWQQLFLTHENAGMTGRFPLNLVCALVAAELSWRWVENPFFRIRDRLAKNPYVARFLSPKSAVPTRT